MSDLLNLLTAPTNILWVAVISAGISTAISYFFKRRETRHKLEVEYEYEQRKRLRELIGRYHGRLLNATTSLNHRLWNLYAHHDKEWLNVNGVFYQGAGYYFVSTVYRFLSVFALIRQLETEAVLLDRRIAEKKDYTFLNYAAALQWVMTDVALFDGLTYDSSSQKDHFFSDYFRHYSEVCSKDQTVLTFEEFSAGPYCSHELEPVLKYFDGLRPDEPRFRWDRIVALHMILMAFNNVFGYKRQYSQQEQFDTAATKLRHRTILTNLVNWLYRHDLGGDKEAGKIIVAEKRLSSR